MSNRLDSKAGLLDDDDDDNTQVAVCCYSNFYYIQPFHQNCRVVAHIRMLFLEKYK